MVSKQYGPDAGRMQHQMKCWLDTDEEAIAEDEFPPPPHARESNRQPDVQESIPGGVATVAQLCPPKSAPSHSSPDSRTPLPQTGEKGAEELPQSAGHVLPFSPSPHIPSLLQGFWRMRQAMLHPSALDWLPSSHSSPLSRMPLPHRPQA